MIKELHERVKDHGQQQLDEQQRPYRGGKNAGLTTDRTIPSCLKRGQRRSKSAVKVLGSSARR